MRVAVVGAGIVGLATAFELMKRGHDVTVHDPVPAGGASHAAAGMLAAVTETVWAHDELHALLRTAAQEYPDFLSQLSAAGGESGFRSTATLSVGVDGADRESLARLATLQRRDGAHVEQLVGSQARRREPALGSAVTTAMLVTDDHQVDPRQITGSLLRVLAERVHHHRVTEVLFNGGTVRGIRSEGGEVTADVVIVAAGLGVHGIGGVPSLPVRPVWGDIMRLRVPEALRPLLTDTVRATVHGHSVYLVPRADGTLVVGASVRESGGEGPHTGSVFALLRDAQKVVPGIEECELVEVIARARPGSPDALPLLGPLAPGLIASTGFDRHGVLLAPLAAKLTARLVDGQPLPTPLNSQLDPYRFSPATKGSP